MFSSSYSSFITSFSILCLLLYILIYFIIPFSYDTVDRDILWEKLRKLGFGEKFIKCLQACHYFNLNYQFINVYAYVYTSVYLYVCMYVCAVCLVLLAAPCGERGARHEWSSWTLFFLYPVSGTLFFLGGGGRNGASVCM